MKLVQETACPHCKKNIELETDVENLKIDDKRTAAPGTVQAPPAEAPPVEEKPKPEIQVKTVAPATQPAFKCKDGKCGKVHKNPNYTQKIKAKCENCGQFTGDPNVPCLFCDNKEFELLEDDDLQELGIPEPEEVPHEHESE